MSDEVLVHISTPATRQNDELFRTLANAYTKFKPHRIHRGLTARERATDQLARRRAKISSTRVRTSLSDETTSLSAPVASKESYGSFPSSVSTCERHLGQDESVRSFSRLAQLDQSYLSWRKRTTAKSSFKDSHEELRTSSDGADADTGFIEDSQSALQALQSQLQDIYSTTSTDTSDFERDSDENPLHVDSQPLLISNPNTGHRRKTVEEPTLPTSPQGHLTVKRVTETSRGPNDLTTYTPQKSQSKQDQMDLDELGQQEPTDVSNHAALVAGDDSNTTQNTLDFSHLAIDVFSPPPTISVACPGTLPSQITRHLAAVKTKNPTRFRPLKIQRDLENDERGFWQVDCTQWFSNAQRDFWLALCEQVRSGRIGWGITLHREHNSRDGLGLVKLYCWGEIVEHTWLLLWLCSEGRICGLRLKWIDACGVAVVETD